MRQHPQLRPLGPLTCWCSSKPPSCTLPALAQISSGSPPLLDVPFSFRVTLYKITLPPTHALFPISCFTSLWALITFNLLPLLLLHFAYCLPSPTRLEAPGDQGFWGLTLSLLSLHAQHRAWPPEDIQIFTG